VLGMEGDGVTGLAHRIVSGNYNGRGSALDVFDFKLGGYSFLGIFVVDGESIVGEESAIHGFVLEEATGGEFKFITASPGILVGKIAHTIFCMEASNGSLVIFSIANRHLWAYRSLSMNGSQSGRYRAVEITPVLSRSQRNLNAGIPTYSPVNDP